MIDVVAAAIFISNNQAHPPDDRGQSHRLDQLCFLSVRRGPGSGAGEWEFPGGKVEPGETHEQALHREILEELGIEIRIHRKLGDTVVVYPQKQIRLHLYLCSSQTQELHLVDHDAAEWLYPGDFFKLHWSRGDLDFMKYFRSLEVK